MHTSISRTRKPGLVPALAGMVLLSGCGGGPEAPANRETLTPEPADGAGTPAVTEAPGPATPAGGEDGDATPEPGATAQPDGVEAGSLPMGRLLFDSDRGDSIDVWMIDSEQDEPIPITTDPDVDRIAAWGPDGDSVIYASDRRGGQSVNPSLRAYGLFVSHLDGSEDEELLMATQSFNHSPKYSPDGSRVAWYSDAGDGISQVWVMDADGGRRTQLTEDPVQANFSDWSPDGEQVLFSSLRDSEGCSTTDGVTTCSDYNREIYVMDADGSNQQRLTDDPVDDGASVFSPDGSTIAFHSDRDGAISIYLMDADGGNVRRLTDEGGDDEFPSWSPDGSMIAFSTDRDGNREIYAVNADGSGLVNVTNHPARDDFPAWGE